MITRRGFLKSAAAAAGSIELLGPRISLGAPQTKPSAYFAVHPAVESAPDAVFIMKTAVDTKLNAEAKKAAGLEFGTTVFVPSDAPGIPITHKITLKTNTILGKGEPPFPEDYLMGAHTDPWFVEGVIDGMMQTGLKGNQFYMRDTSCTFKTLEESGYRDMAKRVDANILETIKARRVSDSVTWVDVPGGTIHRQIPYLWPYNTPDTFLLNIAKFKSHAMGLTLCCKNIQGTIASPFQAFCGGIRGPVGRCDADTLNPDYQNVVEENWRRHVADGVPRWDKPGSYYNCGLGMETWATRTLDNMSVSPMGLSVVEGIYGRDGSHQIGPHPPLNSSSRSRGWAQDFMSNVIIFGKNPVHVDIVGHWLGGHEPGNFGLFHLARERGLTTTIDPRKIPLFSWENGKAVSASLDSFERTPLLTPYLRRNYNGQDEPAYHLCNEPYEYDS